MFTFVLAAVTFIDTYPRAELLIEPAMLARSLKQYHVLDVREGSAYEAGHVPGAVSTSAAEWAKAFQDGKDVAGWSKRIGDLGITVDTKVVVYDDNLNKDAARVWWILKYWGVKDVRLLHGMWTGWKALGSTDISKEPVMPRPVTFVPDSKAERLATKQDVLNAVKSKEFGIVDSRSLDEYTGKKKLAERGGCIPGATHLDWESLVDKRTQRFRPPAELKAIFEDFKVDLNRPQAVHCQSGGRSSVMNFAMELMGAKQVRNYHASWNEWGNDPDTPVDIPKK
jgi:thiosulfate/3-mercaptopyruvate sulfurtransferase